MKQRASMAALPDADTIRNLLLKESWIHEPYQ